MLTSEHDVATTIMSHSTCGQWHKIKPVEIPAQVGLIVSRPQSILMSYQQWIEDYALLRK